MSKNNQFVNYCYWHFDISKDIENDFDSLHFSKEKELCTYQFRKLHSQRFDLNQMSLQWTKPRGSWKIWGVTSEERLRSCKITRGKRTRNYCQGGLIMRACSSSTSSWVLRTKVGLKWDLPRFVLVIFCNSLHIKYGQLPNQILFSLWDLFSFIN